MNAKQRRKYGHRDYMDANRYVRRLHRQDYIGSGLPKCTFCNAMAIHRTADGPMCHNCLMNAEEMHDESED